MCYNKNASKNAFIIGFISSILLIIFGGSKLYTKIGIFFITISLMQLVDYLIWSDLDCINGKNILGGTIGSIIIGLQPLLFFILVCDIDIKKWSPLIFIYILYFIFIFSKLNDKTKCSEYKNKRAYWSWSDVFNSYCFKYIYVLLVGLGIYLGFRNKISRITIILLIITLMISFVNYNYFFGEFWCYFSNIVPLLLLLHKMIL